ncbi:SNF2 family N-terminal domain-containing protein [Bisporella sp. PMI_857]|nr:SNF2 family N-terminal domain-containing protein [Bisporella sp. PMI_857]
MRDADEDHSWMDEDDEGDEEYAQLKEQKAALDVKAKNGKITQNEVMILRKVIKQIKHIERLKAAAARGRQNDGESDNDDFIFRNSPFTEENLDLESSEPAEAAGVVGDDTDQKDAHFHAMLQQALNGQDLGELPLSRETENGKSRKPRKKVAKNARDVVLQKRQKEREKERMKSQRKKARDAGKKNGQANVPKGRAGKAGKSVKGKGAKSSSRAESSRMFSGFNGRTDPIAQMMLDDLFQNDPIQDRISNPIFNVSEEPQIQETKKETQFQRLFANIPSGSSEQDAKSDKKKLQLASKAFGYARVKARNGKWLVKGMKSTLYHHQLLGAQWMLSRELSESSPQGGMLADGMGLGKTVQTIACMVGNPPTEDDKRRQITATLIVVPSSVINQWLSEIREHAEGKIFPKILHYKTKLRLSMEVLRDIDVVLTSYNEVMQQFPFPNQKGREEIARVGYAKWWKKASRSLGILHRITWYRVVLDEAHTIKNNSARTSLACQNLKSVYRWCLTGTPILNRLEELFPYLRFLKAHFAMDWDTFRNYFCDAEGEESQKRIATILSFTMMRRTMATTILNRPIIHLPKPHPEIQYVDFSTQERIIYRITENRFRANLNLYFAGNRKDPRNTYANFLVQLLRLRQCTSHPWMLEQTIKDAWTSEDVTELRSKLRRLKMTDTPFYEQCQLWVSQSKQEINDAQAARDRGEDVPETFPAMPFGRGNFGHEFKMDKALETLNDAEMFARVVCAICSDMPQSPKITDCGHIFCEECITTYMHKMVAEYEDHTFSCPSCDKMFTDLLPYSGPRMMDDGDFSPEPSPETNRPGSTKQPRRSIYNKKKPPRYPNSKGRDALGFEPLTLSSAWLTRSDRDDKFPLTPSAKTTALKAILLKGFKEAPADKVVIYTQFRILARILGRLCASENWGFLYLTGDSSLEHRGHAVRRFQKDPSVKILIAGLKCGGLGLNFPWANRCISLDLWWNHAVEQQAFGRIFRIGQTKETWMTRIVVRNTVDMRLLRMQMHKLKTCEQAVGDGDKKDQAALSIEDVASLFGFLRTDEDGMILEVVPDYISDGDDEGEIEDDENGGDDTGGRMGT